MKVFAQVEIWTPEKAAAALEDRGAGARELKPPRVRELAAAMAAGEWGLNGETLKFSESGVCLDGQHRLAAILESGAEVHLLTVRGLSDDLFDSGDVSHRCGKP